MAEPSEQVLEILKRRTAELEVELDRLRQLESKRPRARHLNPWLGVPVAIIATWTLSAQAPGVTSNLEPRVTALERLIRKGPGNVTQVSAPFEVVGAANAPILVVSGEPTSASPRLGRIQIGRGSGDNFYVKVVGPNRNLVAQMGETKEGVGSFDVYDAQGKLRADLYGKNGLNLYAPGEKPIITLMPDQNGAGVLQINSPSGLRVAELGSDPANGGGGAVRVMGSAGKTTAAMLGGLRGAGAVVVANTAGTPVAELSVSSDGRGLVQVFGRGQRPMAVLTRAIETDGGLLQISNALSPVASLTVGGAGAGYFQMNNAGGQPTLEAGTLPSGNGHIRVGPYWKCSPIKAATPVIGVPGFEDCLVGSSSSK